MSICAVILAGGSGKRLWPLSRAAHPKQFLSLDGEGTMLQETVKRLKNLNTEPQLLYAMKIIASSLPSSFVR